MQHLLKRLLTMFLTYRPPLFPLRRFFSAYKRFVGASANNFWQYGKHSFRKLNELVEYDIWYALNSMVQKLEHININVFLEL